MGDADDNDYVWTDDYQFLLVKLLDYNDVGKFIGGPGFGDDPNYIPCGDMDFSNYLWVDDLQALLVDLLADPDKFWLCP
jgi:hypothetical protein